MYENVLLGDGRAGYECSTCGYEIRSTFHLLSYICDEFVTDFQSNELKNSGEQLDIYWQLGYINRRQLADDRLMVAITSAGEAVAKRWRENSAYEDER
jgi:hypothetical protein